MTKQMRKPAAVVRVRFVATPILDILGIGEYDFHAVLQNIENGFPVRTSALHHDMAAALLDEPVAEKFQFGDDRSKFPNFNLRLGFQWSGHDADHEKFLADVDSCTALDDCFNHLFSFADGANERETKLFHGL